MMHDSSCELAYNYSGAVRVKLDSKIGINFKQSLNLNLIKYTTKLFRGQLSRLESKMVIHGKTFAVACCIVMLPVDVAIVHRKNICSRVKTMKFPPQKFCNKSLAI